MAIQFNDQTAKEAIASGKVVVIDFWATWCGPASTRSRCGGTGREVCRFRGVVVGKLNIDEDSEIVAENRVRNIPTVLFFKDGEVKARSVGLVKLSRSGVSPSPPSRIILIPEKCKGAGFLFCPLLFYLLV